MNLHVPATRLRLLKSQFRHVRLLSSSVGDAPRNNPNRPGRRFMHPSASESNVYNYHFRIPMNEAGQNAEISNTKSNITTLGEQPRFSTVPISRPKIDYLSTISGGDDPGIRMRSVRLEKPPTRKQGARSGIQLAGVASFSLPVFEGPSTPIHLNEFLKKYRPASTSYKEVGPWIFVKRDNENPGYPYSKQDNFACAMKAKDVIDETARRIRSYIDSRQESTPPAEDGWQQRPFFLERVFKSAGPDLRDLAVKYNYTCGGWFALASEEQVNEVFSDLSRSLVAGELRRTAAHAVKVTTTQHPSVPRGVHILWITLQDAWNKESNRRVLEVLTKIHGWVPQGCKPELFVQLGYGHLHKTKSDTCTFIPQDFMTKAEIDEARDEVRSRRIFTRHSILSRPLKGSLAFKS